jgi:hypothetical protein
MVDSTSIEGSWPTGNRDGSVTTSIADAVGRGAKLLN